MEVLQVPAQAIAQRSRLLDDSNQIRDSYTPRSFERGFLLHAGVGLLLLTLLIAPLAARLVRPRISLSAFQPGPTERKQALAARLRVCGWDASEDQAVLSLYGDLARLLREYAGSMTGRRGEALSAAELRGALSGREEERTIEAIDELVRLSDRVRYSPRGAVEGRRRLEDVRTKALHLTAWP